jgi:hypothetical protein
MQNWPIPIDIEESLPSISRTAICTVSLSQTNIYRYVDPDILSLSTPDLDRFCLIALRGPPIHFYGNITVTPLTAACGEPDAHLSRSIPAAAFNDRQRCTEKIDFVCELMTSS